MTRFGCPAPSVATHPQFIVGEQREMCPLRKDGFAHFLASRARPRCLSGQAVGPSRNTRRTTAMPVGPGGAGARPVPETLVGSLPHDGAPASLGGSEGAIDIEAANCRRGLRPRT